MTSPTSSPIQKWIGDEPIQKWIGYRNESKIGSITRNRLLTNVNHNPKLDRAYQARHINGLEVGSKLSPAITNSKLSPLINDLHQNSKLSPDQNWARPNLTKPNIFLVGHKWTTQKPKMDYDIQELRSAICSRILRLIIHKSFTPVFSNYPFNSFFKRKSSHIMIICFQKYF